MELDVFIDKLAEKTEVFREHFHIHVKSNDLIHLEYKGVLIRIGYREFIEDFLQNKIVDQIKGQIAGIDREKAMAPEIKADHTGQLKFIL